MTPILSILILLVVSNCCFVIYFIIREKTRASTRWKHPFTFNVEDMTDGMDKFYVNAKGNVKPCEFLNISFDNIANEEFEPIYDRMKNVLKRRGSIFYANSPRRKSPNCMSGTT